MFLCILASVRMVLALPGSVRNKSRNNVVEAVFSVTISGDILPPPCRVHCISVVRKRFSCAMAYPWIGMSLFTPPIISSGLLGRSIRSSRPCRGRPYLLRIICELEDRLSRLEQIETISGGLTASPKF